MRREKEYLNAKNCNLDVLDVIGYYIIDKLKGERQSNARVIGR